MTSVDLPIRMISYMLVKGNPMYCIPRSGIYSDLTFRRQVQSLIKTYYRVTGKIESTVLRAIQ